MHGATIKIQALICCYKHYSIYTFHAVFILVPGWCLTVQLAAKCFCIERKSNTCLFRSLRGHEAGCVTYGPRGFNGSAAFFVWYKYTLKFFSPPPPVPPHVLMNFRGFPPGCGDSVADFWGWDAHEARLRCPDGVSGDRGGCSARRGLKPKFHWSTQTIVTVGIFPFKENSHGRAGNPTWYLMISSQRPWSLDHEAGHTH